MTILVEGNWGSWSSYGKCQCLQERTRVCDNPKPSGGGASCSGVFSQKTECGDCMVTDLKGEWKNHPATINCISIKILSISSL